MGSSNQFNGLLQGLGLGQVTGAQGYAQAAPAQAPDNFYQLWVATTDQLKRAHELIGRQQLEIERLRNTKEWLVGPEQTK